MGTVNEPTLTPTLEREMREAAVPLAASIADSGVPWATADELQACPAEKLRYTRESADFVAACSPANVLALFTELDRLRSGALTPERVSAYLAGLDDVAFLEVLAASGERGSQAVLRQFHELRAAKDELDRLRAENAELKEREKRAWQAYAEASR